VKNADRRRVPAIMVRQWLRGWDRIEFSAKAHRRKPIPHFYVFSLSAVELRSLCGIARRKTLGLTPRAADLGIQRQLDVERSFEIGNFVEFGFPWSTLSEAKRRSAEFHDLRKPGWLPTAIVINILREEDERENQRVASSDVVKVITNDRGCELELPYLDWSVDWNPSSVPPFEVIDGQHRLWAFDSQFDRSFQLPVVAFHGLDISWQAYLFWTINIKPKRINPSLAFDLYPLLRAQDWLDRGEGHSVYRETRSQELTEALWSHPESPWYDRINMLGEKGNPWVSQSAWIRSLMATFVRRWEGRRSGAGGLFGSRVDDTHEVLGWSRAQQAAFLIFIWQELRSRVADSKADWAKSLRATAVKERLSTSLGDPAFYGPYSLIKTDQGVRGYLHVANDLCFKMAPKLQLRNWDFDATASATDAEAVSTAIKSISKHKASHFLKLIAVKLSTFDWRTSAAPDLTEAERQRQLVFRGSSGYKELRALLLKHLGDGNDEISSVAKQLRETAK
jgi:DGQHR domain-containing protein